MGKIRKPTPSELERIAAKQPALLNLLVAYFVMEWQHVGFGQPPHGKDQMGEIRLIPNFVALWGSEACLRALLEAPEQRQSTEPGYLSEWLEEISSSPGLG